MSVYLPRAFIAGRSAAAKEFHPDAIELAIRAYARRRHTYYDLFAASMGRHEARNRVTGQVEEILGKWRKHGH